MTLYNLIKSLQEVALEEPNIRFVGEGDIYELNSIPTIDYNVFYVTQNQHRVADGFMNYSLNLFYISRWDETNDNQLNIQSDGIVALKDIIDRFVARYPVVDYSEILYQPFYQRFKDICAGVYATVTFNVPIDECYEEGFED